MTATARVLVVCTANQCRSPMIEMLLRRALTDHGVTPPWEIRSAGTRAVDGHPAHPHTRAVLESRGVQCDDFRSRRLDAEKIAASDLILTAERAHASEVVSLVPDVLHRTFTFQQFARLLRAGAPARQHPPVTVADLVELAQRSRSRSEPSDDDLADPIGARRRKYETMASQIDSAIADIIVAIGHPATHPHRPSSPETARI